MEDLGPVKYFIGVNKFFFKKKQLPYIKMHILAKSLNNIV